MPQYKEQLKKTAQEPTDHLDEKNDLSNEDAEQKLKETLELLQSDENSLLPEIEKRKAEIAAQKKENAAFVERQDKRFKRLKKEATERSMERFTPLPNMRPNVPMEPVSPQRLRPPAQMSSPSIADWQPCLDDD
ncbi:MAG: hypothetical protein HQL69_20915 [Magnetococcales bacterium]|nr:hypothetical protein [Magnetococcales bacterium]